MKELLEGNAGFIAKSDKTLLKELAEKGQHPVAAVIACSDSRVPVEAIFDQIEPGRLFVVRVAGNVVADASVKGSIEYAVEHLRVPRVIVLGHTGCGAVKARLENVNEGELGRLLALMDLTSKDPAEAVAENVARQVAALLEIGAVREAVEKKTLAVFGAIYDLATGRVNVMDG